MRKKLIAVIVLSLIAVFNAWYLTKNAYELKQAKEVAKGSIIPFACDINSTFSCSWVFTHDFARPFGIPFALIALFVYPMIILVASLWLAWKIKKHFTILFYMWIGWFLFNSYFIVNEFIVNTYCILCLMCTVIIVTIAILWKYWEIEQRKINWETCCKEKSCCAKKDDWCCSENNENMSEWNEELEEIIENKQEDQSTGNMESDDSKSWEN